MDLNPELLVQRSGTLSLLSASAEEANRLIASPECNIAHVVRVIERDGALSARLLGLMNSPMFGFPASVTTIGRAVTILGPRDLGDLTIAAAVVNAYERLAGQTGSFTQRFWERALYGAVTARLLAELRREPHPDRFFVAGLLHDVGSMVLQLAIPNLYAQSIKLASHQQLPQHEAEKRLIGIDHSEVGGALARGWGLSDSLTAAIADHHDPSQSPYPLDASVAHVADHVADRALRGEPCTAQAIDRRVWDCIAVPPGRLGDHQAEIVDRVAAMRHALSAQIQAA